MKEKILLCGDSIQGPTGFANDLAGVAWSLADKYDVHLLGLQSFQDEKVKLNLEGEQRTMIQHANRPRSEERWDFGKRSLPRLLNELEPEIFLTVNDIQMISHVPEVMCPNNIRLQVIDLPSKKYISEYALTQQLQGEMQKFKEQFPRKTKWIGYSPQDGDPPMQMWGNIYKMMDQAVAMSNYGKDIFQHYFKMDVPKIWHGVDSVIFKKTKKPDGLKDRFVVGDINRNQPRKQPIRTMMAFAKFCKDKPDVLLHMQMDWNDEFGWPIQYFAEMYGIMNKMIQPMQVGVPREKVSEIYNMWDLNTMATGGEGFGLPTIEGGACELPTLGIDYTTSKELLIEGEPSPRGTLIKVKDLHWQKMDVAAVRRALVDIDDMAAVMNKYYYNRDLAKEHGKNARIWIEKNCTWAIIQKEWKDLVGDVLSGNNKV